MASKLKIRISDLGASTPPFFSILYSDGSILDNVHEITFNFVAVRNNPFEAVIGPNPNQSLKDAIDLDLVPSGEWTTSIDDYYLYVETNVEERWVYLVKTSHDMVKTVEISEVTYEPPIDITQSLDSTALLNAFNDNVLIFQTSKSKVNVTANNQLPVTLYPSPLGAYYLNLKDFSTTLINQNNFEDEILPNIETDGYVYADPSLFLEMNINLSGENFSQDAKAYFLKSVAQIKNYSEKLVTKNYVLLPKVTYYPGYPFDIPVFCSKAQQVIIHNRTTGHSAALDFNQYVNRLFLSQGSQDFTIDDILPMQTGINRLELEFGPIDKFDLIVQKKESKCAPYFKFYRNGGGFGYIRFESEVGVKNTAQEGESIPTDFNGIQNTLRRSITEKQTRVSIDLQTEALEPYEMDNFQDFISSPRVEMYVGDLFQQQTEKSWVGVDVSSNSLNIKKPKASKLKEKATVQFDLYNLHL